MVPLILERLAALSKITTFLVFAARRSVRGTVLGLDRVMGEFYLLGQHENMLADSLERAIKSIVEFVEYNLPPPNTFQSMFRCAPKLELFDIA